MNILVFCSNPVNGGTAKIFYELVDSFSKNKRTSDKIFAAINANNPVEIYKKIEFLDRINVYSEEQVCEGMYGGNIFSRIIKRIFRKIKYFSVMKTNEKVMMEYLMFHNIDSVIIHNGGYVGDDVCNQMLHAAYKCRKNVRCRVFVMHSDFEKNRLSKIRFWGYDRKICREATELVTVSNYTRNRLLAQSYIDKDIKVIYNGLPGHNKLEKSEKEKKFKFRKGKKNILILGNFLKNKGQLQFIETTRILNDKRKDVNFFFVGNVYDEEYFALCIEKINQYRLNNCVEVLHGINDAAEYMDLFDLIAIPSMEDESFGLISVEAMSKAIPVVAFACGGIPEVIINGKDGFVVPIGDCEAMAEKIDILLDDAKICKQMGINGRKEYLEHFSLDVMSRKYYDLIENYRRV